MAPNSKIHHARRLGVEASCISRIRRATISFLGPLTKGARPSVRWRFGGSLLLIRFFARERAVVLSVAYAAVESLLASATVSQPSGTSASLWHCVQYITEARCALWHSLHSISPCCG